MITPGKYDFVLPQGASWDDVWTLKISGAAYDLTGCTARLQLRTSPSATTTALSLTEASGMTLGGAAGTITFGVADTVTAAIVPGKYWYDLEVESAGGLTNRWLQGFVTVTAEVSR